MCRSPTDVGKCPSEFAHSAPGRRGGALEILLDWRYRQRNGPSGETPKAPPSETAPRAKASKSNFWAGVKRRPRPTEKPHHPVASLYLSVGSPSAPHNGPPSVCNRYVQLAGQRRPTRILTSGPRRRKWLHCGAHPAGIARPRVRRTATSGFPRAAHPPRLTRRAQLPCGLHRAVRTKRRPGRGSLPRRGREAVVRGRRGHDPGRCL